jgi:hypothetical protein
MDHGRIVAHGSPGGLVEQFSTREVLELRFDSPDLAAQAGLLSSLDGVADRVEVLPERLLLYVDDGEAAQNEAHRRGLRRRSRICSFGGARRRVGLDSNRCSPVGSCTGEDAVASSTGTGRATADVGGRT